MFQATLRRRQARLHRSQASKGGSSEKKRGSVVPDDQPSFGVRSPFASPRLLTVFTSLSLFLVLLLSRRPTAQLPSAYALCTNNATWTVSPTTDVPDVVDCVLVRDGLVDDVGSWMEVKGRWREKGGRGKLRRRKLRDGWAIYPGFQDAHGHLLEHGWSKTVVDLTGAASKEEAVARVRTFVLSHPELRDNPSRWVEGMGWDQTRWTPADFPSAADLSSDPVLRDRPISLRRVDVHALWINEHVLDMLHPLPSKVDGGLVVRDEEGRPTGVLLDNAMDLVFAAMPLWTEEDMNTYLSAASQDLLAKGIVSVGDAAASLSAIEFYTSKATNGGLPLHVYAFVSCPKRDEYCGDGMEKVVGLGTDEGAGSGKFTFRTVKLFTDGALGSWGAAMWEGYSDRPDERGLLLMEPAAIEPLVRKWVEKGFQVATHAIGDRANALVLDAYEQVLQSAADDERGADIRLRVEHAQVLRQEDIARIGPLGVIASMQPTHCTSDFAYAETRVGRERVKGAYAWRSLADHGTRVALGSDFPVEDPDPVMGFYAAITRLAADGTSPHGPGGWYANETLSRKDALRGFTLDVAYSQFEERVSGSLERGKRADLVVLDRDIMTVDADKVKRAKVRATIVGGKVRWGGV